MIIGVEMNDDITTFLSISLKYFVFTLLIREIEAMVSYIGVGTIVYLLLLIPIVYFEIKYLVYKKLDLENITRDGLLLYFLIFFPLINIFLGISLFYTLMVVAFLLILNKEKINNLDGRAFISDLAYSFSYSSFISCFCSLVNV